MNAAEEALAQANLREHEMCEMWHYQAEPTPTPTEPRKRTWLSKWLLGEFKESQALTDTLILRGKQTSPAGPGGISLDMFTTGYLQFLSPSYVRLTTGYMEAHFVLGKEGEEGLPEAGLRPPGSITVLIRTNEATFCIVRKDVIFTREAPYETIRMAFRMNQLIPQIKIMEEVHATLEQLDGATLEWRGYSHHSWRYLFVLKVTDSSQGVGCLFIQGTNYINFPPLMHNVHIRTATGEEVENLGRQFQAREGIRE